MEQMTSEEGEERAEMADLPLERLNSTITEQPKQGDREIQAQKCGVILHIYCIFQANMEDKLEWL